MITIDTEYYERKAESILREEAQKRLDTLIIQHTLWDMEELVRQTKMSVPFIKEHFFYDENFPKKKIGSKWWMDAELANEFIRKWWQKQPNA